MNRTIHKIGFQSGLVAFFSILLYCIVQLLQVARLIHFPLDERLIYGSSLCIVIPLLLAFLALHYITPAEKRFWSHTALIFATIYAVFVTANYVVQLATVIPLKLKDAAGTVQVLEQTPHSMFWNYDAIGYIFMGLATLAAVPLFQKHGFQRWVRITFLAHALVTPLIAVVYFYPVYSEKLLVLGYPWAVTAPLSMLLLALLFKRNSRIEKAETSKKVSVKHLL